MKLHFSNLKMAGTDKRTFRTPQRGVALIITLILLAVVTVMAVAFLASSRRERGAVTTTTDTASVRLAADGALAQAESQIMANIQVTTNPYNFGLVVSTNYLPPTTGNSLDDLTNMLISPRAPVWLSNYVTRVMENRFYLDLNHNAEDDPSGWVTNRNQFGAIIFNADGSPSTNLQVGDPEWIGVLDHPDQPHGPNNRFIARYAFIAVPIGNALDLNAIYNDAMQPDQTMRAGNDGFLRNQGVGSWEINLAAFLTDLNTNQWDPPTVENAVNDSYNYLESQAPNGINRGRGFEDALSLLKYRYGGANGSYTNLATVQNLFGPNGTVFQNDDIDGYSDGPLMVNTFLQPENETPSSPWSGADNTNHFFDMQELFSTNDTSPAFVKSLTTAGGNPLLPDSTYDRYTFYRLLSQLGTDSAPEQNEMNLNYVNVDANGNVVPGMETNFFQWSALQFFTNAADRMLRAYSQDWLARDPSNYLATYFNTNGVGMTTIPLIGVTDIPVYVNGANVYSSAINRVLQLAANMYDATTNRYYPPDFAVPLPTVFQPIFSVMNGNVYISSFVEVTSTNFLANPLLNLNYGTNVLTTLQNNPGDLVSGVPLIIGAKKGFPNFNEFAMQNAFQLTRKLQVTRNNTNSPVSSYQVNQMFNLSVTNQLGVECWNSYTNNYNRPTAIYVTNYLSVMLTNDENLQPVGASFPISGYLQIPNPTNNIWPGYNLAGIASTNTSASFQIPLTNNVAFIPDSMYRFNGGNPFLTTNLALQFETNVVIPSKYPQPNWSLMVTNNLQVIMVDVNSGRIIDYVQLSGPNSSRTNLNEEIQAEQDTGNLQGYNGLWLTNLDNQGMPFGLDYQLGISLGSYGLGSGPNAWKNVDPTEASNEINGFRAFYKYQTFSGYTNNIGLDSSTNSMQVPYTPTATTFQHITLQANDPLVHYIASDLNGAPGNTNDANYNWPGNLGQLNDRYMPWSGNPLLTGADRNPYNPAIKDPLVSSSDYWDFPTYKLPTVGWLGRVHRGTPWQTVFLKSTNILDEANGVGIATWSTNWTGDLNAFDADNSSPGEDWHLFDLFSSAFNDNATRGQLSVNVGAPNGPSLAAWSALFSGIVVPTNTIGGYTVVQPAGVYNAALPLVNQPPLVQLATGIYQTRTNLNLFPLQTFTHVGDILAVPALTDQSPFLTGLNATNGITDEMYEWLPQQTMSLLHVANSPRYVIYCYGQTLKPAQNGIVTGGSLFGICTNYQVVAETATRAVVRIDSTVTNVPTLVTNSLNQPVWPNTPVPPSVTNNRVVIESFNVLPPD
jgi:hypothetical protein